MSKYELDPEWTIFFLPGLVVAAIGFWLFPKPWKNIIGVGAMWIPLLIMQIQFENYILFAILTAFALYILFDCWNDD